jgi:colanic acid/amylovoran biosynthesis glycosyltransferase
MVRLVLAGRRRDRLPSWLLPRWIRWLGLEDQVQLRPPESDPRVLYHAADALVLPSFAEGMPNVAIEAQLCGLPVVLTRQANRDNIVSHGQTGLQVPTGDRRALAAALGQVSGMSAEARQRMGALGRQRAHERFCLAPGIAPFEALYQAAVESRRPG